MVRVVAAFIGGIDGLSMLNDAERETIRCENWSVDASSSLCSSHNEVEAAGVGLIGWMRLGCEECPLTDRRQTRKQHVRV